MKRKLVVGNWKMNGDLRRNARLLEGVVRDLPDGIDCAVCVPFPYLPQVQEMVAGSRLRLGAQNVSEFADGAYTGEISAAMLADIGVQFVVVGHSERRALFGETDDAVARKALAALGRGLTPIVCVGETLAERDEGKVEAVLERQLNALTAAMEAGQLARLVLAYEPVWAIGTGRAASPAQVQEVLAFIRAWLRERVVDADAVTVLYGGSVKADTAGTLFGLPDADGGLIGGASLDSAQFLEICKAAAAVSPDKVD